MAGGGPKQQGGEAKYTETQFAKQGDLGTAVLPAAPTGIVWTRNTVYVSTSATMHNSTSLWLCCCSLLVAVGVVVSYIGMTIVGLSCFRWLASVSLTLSFCSEFSTLSNRFTFNEYYISLPLKVLKLSGLCVPTTEVTTSTACVQPTRL